MAGYGTFTKWPLALNLAAFRGRADESCASVHTPKYNSNDKALPLDVRGFVVLAQRELAWPFPPAPRPIAFSSEVDAGSRQENASKQESGARF